jgi:hypothetical protein
LPSWEGQELASLSVANFEADGLKGYGETHNVRHTQLAIFGCKMRCSQNLLDVALAPPPGVFSAPHFSLEADFADCAFLYAFLNNLRC